MSNSTAHDPGPIEVPSGYGTLFRPVKAAGFWAAVGLPFVYVPLMLTGVQTTAEQLALGVLLGVHVLALILGRHHNAE